MVDVLGRWGKPCYRCLRALRQSSSARPADLQSTESLAAAAGELGQCDNIGHIGLRTALPSDCGPLIRSGSHGGQMYKHKLIAALGGRSNLDQDVGTGEEGEIHLPPASLI